jgi:hypothetical protein
MITQIVDGKRIVNKEYIDTYTETFDTLISLFLKEMGFYLEDEFHCIWKKDKFFRVEIGANFIECKYLSNTRDHIFEGGWKEALTRGEKIKYRYLTGGIGVYELLSVIICDLRELWEEHESLKKDRLRL